MLQTQIIGIVGGLGPYAHIDFEQKLLESARTMLGAQADQDYPEWVLSSIPRTPDRTRAIVGTDTDPLPWLLRSIRRLERGNDQDTPGADFVAIPCNTAHLFLPALREQVSIPILDMIRATARAVTRAHPLARVGILATNGTLASRSS